MKLKKNLILFKYKFITLLMKKSNKVLAEKILNSILFNIKKKTNSKNPLEILYSVFKNKSPLFEIESKKVGKKVLLVPYPIKSKSRREYLLMKKLIDLSKKSNGSFEENFSSIVIDAFNNKGFLVQQQLEMHDLVFSNKSRINFRW